MWPTDKSVTDRDTQTDRRTWAKMVLLSLKVYKKLFFFKFDEKLSRRPTDRPTNRSTNKVIYRVTFHVTKNIGLNYTYKSLFFSHLMKNYQGDGPTDGPTKWLIESRFTWLNRVTFDVTKNCGGPPTHPKIKVWPTQKSDWRSTKKKSWELF